MSSFLSNWVNKLPNDCPEEDSKKRKLESAEMVFEIISKLAGIKISMTLLNYHIIG